MILTGIHPGIAKNAIETGSTFCRIHNEENFKKRFEAYQVGSPLYTY
jgi:hypothetical protein